MQSERADREGEDIQKVSDSRVHQKNNTKQCSGAP